MNWETYTYTPIIYLLFFVAEFSVLLPCAGKGIAQFGIGLMIESRNGIPLNGTPLRFRLRKECSVRGECVNRAHDHHLFARTYSSVSAVIHQPNLLPHALLIDCLEAGRLNVSANDTSRMSFYVHVKFSGPEYFRLASLSFCLIRQPLHVPVAVWTLVLIPCKRNDYLAYLTAYLPRRWVQ